MADYVYLCMTVNAIKCVTPVACFTSAWIAFDCKFNSTLPGDTRRSEEEEQVIWVGIGWLNGDYVAIVQDHSSY